MDNNPNTPYDGIDITVQKMFDPDVAETMEDVNSYRNGDLDHGLSFGQQMMADEAEDALDASFISALD